MNLENSRPFGLRSVGDRPLVLVADDHEDNLLVLTHALRLLDFTYICTTKGKSALWLAQTCRPDLILLDIVLTDMDGVDVIQHLKQNSNTENIPIVAITALAQTEERTQLLQMGCSDYLYKPYSFNALERLLKLYLTPIRSAS